VIRQFLLPLPWDRHPVPKRLYDGFAGLLLLPFFGSVKLFMVGLHENVEARLFL
jgi:hypothetical protein